MKGVYGCAIFLSILFQSFSSFAQTTGDYRSFASGNWNDVNTWERFDGSQWVNPAPSAPLNTSGAISIRNGHTVTVTVSTNGDQMRINNGGILTIASGVVFTVWTGSGDDLTIELGGEVNILNGGTLTIRNSPSPPPPAVALVRVHGTVNNAGAITNASTTTLIFEAGSTYDHQFTTSPGTIPTATWNVTSTCLVTGYTSNATAPAGLGQTFGNFVWDTPSLETFIDLNGALRTVNGDLTFQNIPASYVYLTSTSDYTLNVGGNFTVSNSFFGLNSTATTATINVIGNVLFSNNGDFNPTFDGQVTLDVGGDLEFSAGTTNLTYGGSGNILIYLEGDFTLSSTPTINDGGTGTYTLTFDGSDFQNYEASQAFPGFSFIVQNGSKVQVANGNFFAGAGSLTLQAGATLGVGSLDGLATGVTTGNVRITGSRNYLANANIVYNATAGQNLGNEWGLAGALNGIAVNLEIANTAGVTNNIIGSTSLVGDLTLTSGPLNIGNSNTLVIQSNFAATNGTIGGLSTSNLTFSGSGTITGNLNFASGAQNLNNLTISRDATIPIGTQLTINGVLSFTEAGELRFYDQTLTINGNITQSGGGASGGLESNSSSNLIIGGTGALSSLPFVNSSQINNITFGKTSGGTYTLASALTVNGTLALNSGTLTHSSGLAMATGSTFSRNAGASITTNSPNTTGSYNVSYSGALDTGLELPATATALNNLTVSGDVNLTKAITINGDLNLNSGTFAGGAFNITMAGGAFAANGGAFTINSDKTVTFSRSGTTTMSGTSIAGTQFGHLTINTGTTLSAPNANINISGTWNNQGSFTANGSTVTFNGTNQNLDPNGQPFNNVVFANSGIKSLEGILDVNGSLTIDTGVELDAVSAGNTIQVAGTWENSGTFTASGNTVIFDGTSQTITEAGSFFDLQLAGSGTKTLGAALDVDNDLLIDANVTFNPTASHAITLGGDWTNNGTFTTPSTGGIITFNGTTIIGGSSITRFRNVTLAGAVTSHPTSLEIAGNWLQSSGTFNANNGTVAFNSTGAQSITPGGQSFYNLTIAGGSTKTLQGEADVNGNLTLSSATFSVGTNHTVRVAGNFDASGGGILAAQSGLFIFDGASQNITSAGEAFFNVLFAGSGTKTLIDAFDANGNMDINRPLAAGANSINVAGDWDASTGSFTTTGTTTLDGAAQNIISNGSSFGTLIVAGTGTKTLQDALDANGSITISSTLSVGAGNYPIAAGGDWNSSSGTFTPSGGTVTLDGAAQNITLGAANNFRNLTLSGSGTKTLVDAIDVNGNLLISAGALNTGNNDVEIAGSWTNNVASGGFVAGTAKVTFDGGGTSDVNGTGTTQFYAIDVTGNTNVEIETTQSMTGTLTLVGLSSRFDADGSGNSGVFTLISSDDDPTVDARIATLPVPGNFTGNATVQRFMSQESMPTLSNNRLYRYISSPVANAPVSQIQSEIPVTGSFTGASTCSGCVTSSQSMFAYDEDIGTTFDDGWVDFPSLANTEVLQQAVGYAIFVRGNIIPSASWDVSGPVHTGNIPSPQLSYDPQGFADADGFNLVGNPYPSTIDWNLVYAQSTDLANAIYMLDNPNGRYAQWVDGVSTNNGTPYIAMGQAFWVQAIAGNPSMPLTESMKTSNATSFFREGAPKELLRIALSQSGLSDEMVIRFKDQASDNFDVSFDAWKLQNPIFNLSSLIGDGKKLSINTLSSVECGREIDLDVSNVTTGRYDLSLTGMESFSDEVRIKLYDAYLGELIDVRTTSMYSFDVDVNKPETFGTQRFKVLFEFNGSVVEPELVTSDVCEGTSASVEISNTSADVTYALYKNNALVVDAGFGNGSSLNVTIPTDQLSSGTQTFELRAVSAVCDQISVFKEFELSAEPIPAISNAKGSTVCGSGMANLEASGAEEGNYRWYEAASDVQPIAGATSSIFTTPELNKSKTYFVAAVNELGCEGARVEVLAEVVSFDPVTLTENNQGQLISSYTTGNQWYRDGELIAGATNQSYTPTESGTYTVEVKTGQCTTTAQREFLVTGIDEEFSNGRISVYPNPVKNTLTIESRFEQTEPPLISDPTGKVIGSIPMTPGANGWSGTFDFRGTPRGIYILKVTDQGVSKYKRIVKE